MIIYYFALSRVSPLRCVVPSAVSVVVQAARGWARFKHLRLVSCLMLMGLEKPWSVSEKVTLVTVPELLKHICGVGAH